MFILFLLKLVLIAYFQINCVSTKNLPPHFPKCYQMDPRLSECVKNATNTLRSHLIHGIPELGISEIDPLVIPMVKLEQGTKTVNYKAMLKNVTVHGLGNYTFTDLYLQTDMFAINGKVKFDHIKIDADYFLTGRILNIPIHGTGMLTADFNDAICTFDLKGQVVHKRGKEYYTNANTTVDIQAESGQIYFDKLFDGDETLSKVTNDFIKVNSNKLAVEIKPAIELVLRMYVDNIIENISSSYSFNELFPKLTSR